MLRITDASRLVLRMPSELIRDAMPLSGKRLNIEGHSLVVGVPSPRTLRPSSSVRSRLWSELEAMDPLPSDGEVEAATRMLEVELWEFRANYPGLVRSRGLGEALVGRVMARVLLLRATPQ